MRGKLCILSLYNYGPSTRSHKRVWRFWFVVFSLELQPLFNLFQSKRINSMLRTDFEIIYSIFVYSQQRTLLHSTHKPFINARWSIHMPYNRIICGASIQTHTHFFQYLQIFNERLSQQSKAKQSTIGHRKESKIVSVCIIII